MISDTQCACNTSHGNNLSTPNSGSSFSSDVDDCDALSVRNRLDIGSGRAPARYMVARGIFFTPFESMMTNKGRYLHMIYDTRRINLFSKLKPQSIKIDFVLDVPGIRGRLVPKYKQQRQCVGSFHEFQEQLTRSQSKPINHNLNPYSKFTTAEILDLYLEDPIATLLDLLALRCALVLRWIGF